MIEKILTLSTAHVTADTAAQLDDRQHQMLGIAPFICFQKDDYGWFVHVPTVPEVTWHGQIPPDLNACMAMARAEGCTWLMFDCDADPVEGLPTYDGED